VFEKGINEAERAMWKIHKYRKQKIFKMLEKHTKHKLFMVWFDPADLAGRFYMSKSKLKVMRAYFKQ